MALDKTTFEYLQPTPTQVQAMKSVRYAFKDCATIVEDFLPEGADRTYVLRKLRECAMWANVAITRDADGSARK